MGAIGEPCKELLCLFRAEGTVARPVRLHGPLGRGGGSGGGGGQGLSPRQVRGQEAQETPEQEAQGRHDLVEGLECTGGEGVEVKEMRGAEALACPAA